MPLYGLAFNLAQLIVLAYGIYLIAAGSFTVGLLIGFLLYVNSFYMPLRQLAAVWSSFQLALAGLDRISEVLALESNMPVDCRPAPAGTGRRCSNSTTCAFSYPGGQEVLRDATFALERGKTYALVGPTGGGKTTTASLMARLYDPTGGRVLLDGRDIRTYSPAERAQQDRLHPAGAVSLHRHGARQHRLRQRRYCSRCRRRDLPSCWRRSNLDGLLARFEQGLDDEGHGGRRRHQPRPEAADRVHARRAARAGDSRSSTRRPPTSTPSPSSCSSRSCASCPPSTTKVIIAHRLNTIDNADEIFFINAGDDHAGRLDGARARHAAARQARDVTNA